MNEKIIKIMSLVLQISPSGTPAEKDKPIATVMYHGAMKVLDASVRQQNKTLIEEMVYCNNTGIGVEKQLNEVIEALEKVLKGEDLSECNQTEDIKNNGSGIEDITAGENKRRTRTKCVC